MAVEKGYLDIPCETSLDEMAEGLGVSSQAASERIRRGSETVFRKALIGLMAADFDSSDGE